LLPNSSLIGGGEPVNDTFQYTPDLFENLVEAIPRLVRSKQDLLLFFQGAGAPHGVLAEHEAQLRGNKDDFNKFRVARAVLTALNALGDAGLRSRRELLRRVVEFEDFGVCWPNEQAAARGYVGRIRDMVNVKDSFTRMQMEKDEERRARASGARAKLEEAEKKRVEREAIRKDLFALFGMSDPHRRGRQLEGVLNRLFASYGILVRESFTVGGPDGEGTVEQVDGAIELDGTLYLVEMKWWHQPIGVPDVAPHLVRVFSRGGQVRGVFISHSDFTEPAIAQCRDAINRGSVIVLALLEEIVAVLDQQAELRPWLQAKIDIALLDKVPFARPTIR
jgi:hypothetical protein